jgi:hypothetical protein
MAQQFSLQAQAEEIALRINEELDFIAKNRGKKPAEILGCMEIRIDCMKEARDTLFWLAKNEDLVRERAGEAKKPENAEIPEKTVILAENPKKPLPEGWEVVSGRIFNEDGDLVPDSSPEDYENG